MTIRNMKNSIICIVLMLIINCSAKRDLNQSNDSIENVSFSQDTSLIAIAPLSSLLKNFENATLPYPNDIDTFTFRKFPKQDEALLRTILLSCDLLTIVDQSDQSDSDVWEVADLWGDSSAMKYLVEDTLNCIVPGFVFSRNENLAVVSIHTGSEQQGVDSNFLHHDQEIVCTINSQGECINAITAGYTNGNINGFVARAFVFDTTLTFHIHERGGITQDSSGYSIQRDYKILTDGRMELQ